MMILTFRNPLPMIVNRYGRPLPVAAAWVAASHEDMSFFIQGTFIDCPSVSVRVRRIGRVSTGLLQDLRARRAGRAEGRVTKVTLPFVPTREPAREI
jgi:hypothetical protein